MSRVNYWIVLEGNATSEIENRIALAEADDPQPYDPEVINDVAAEIVATHTYDRAHVTGSYRADGAGASLKTLYSMYWASEDNANSDVGRMTIAYPGRVRLMGGWNYETGAIIKPLAPQLINHMPDIDGLPATQLRDVNLLAGQANRVFE